MLARAVAALPAAARSAEPVRQEPARHETVEPIQSVVRDIGVPVAIRLAQILVQLLVVALFNAGSGHSLAGRFTIWDGQLYAQIAEFGYPNAITVSPGNTLTSGNNLAFSPLYPGLTAVLHRLTGLGVLESAVLITVLSGCALSVIVHLIVRSSGRARVDGYLACALIGVLPMSVVLQMGYAEALFAALSAGAFLAATRGQWLTAGGLAFLAGLTRPIGYVAVAPLPFIGWAMRRSTSPTPGRPSWPTIAWASAIGLSSTPLYWAFVALRTHRLNGWFEVEQVGWGTHFDWGVGTARFIWSTATRHDSADWVAGCVVAILILAVLAVIAVADWEHLPFVALAAVVLVSVAMSTNYWHSKPRLLMGAALLVIPLAQQLAKLRLRCLIPLIGMGFAASCWFGAYMITQWPYAI